MKKTEHADRETRDIRHGVAAGKGFFNSFMSKLNGNSHTTNLFDQLGETLTLLVKKPRRESEIELPGNNGRRLEELITQHRRSHRDYPQQEGFLYILRRLPSQMTVPPQRLTPIVPTGLANDPSVQQKFYLFNLMIARGLTPQEAEKQVDRMYSTI